ncbi:hypothetical protein M9H77_07572 [Catharanthus roseus]|uniref:Uncharacterized protein n=1 Tax=Catharanthus roseus TaxID=4058 RepID=A0ACC0BVK6_CATRO|nr:hypothetical protein M9H77_07572 [Catharanthus roseus]
MNWSDLEAKQFQGPIARAKSRKIKELDLLKEEEDAILEQSSGRNPCGHSMHNIQWAYDNFSPYARSYEHNSYDRYEGNRLGARNGFNDKSYKRVQRNEIRKEGHYVNMDGIFHKRRDDYERYYNSH